MKKSLFLLLSSLLLSFTLWSQNDARVRAKAAVLHIDTKGLNLDPVQMGDMTRIELDKTGVFEVLDRYDVQYLIDKDKLDITNCFGKICLVDVGKKLGVDKMLTGSVELLGEKIVVSFRLINVNNSTVEKSQIYEFLNLKPQIQTMISVTIKQLLGIQNDSDLMAKLTKTDALESQINQPDQKRLNLSGPRMGVTVFTGDAASRVKAPSEQGGLNGTPVMFQFGYQFETAYLNQGGLQALFEFIPIITGLDQSQILPSISILHGIRSNKKGWEFAFGPILYLSKVDKGFYNTDGTWENSRIWLSNHPEQPIPFPEVTRLDTRGDSKIVSSFVFGFGKTFRSGNMNIPVNLFVIPSNSGTRFGVSVGFNGKG